MPYIDFKGYRGFVEYDLSSKRYVGFVRIKDGISIQDPVRFSSKSFSGIERSFRSSVTSLIKNGSRS